MASTALRTAVLFSLSSTATEAIKFQCKGRAHLWNQSLLPGYSVTSGTQHRAKADPTHSQPCGRSARSRSSPRRRQAQTGVPAHAQPPRARAAGCRPAAPVDRQVIRKIKQMGCCNIQDALHSRQSTACLYHHLSEYMHISRLAMRRRPPAWPPPTVPAPRPARLRAPRSVAGCPPGRAPAGRSACRGSRVQTVCNAAKKGTAR